MVLSMVRLREWWQALLGPASPPVAALPRSPDIGWCPGCGCPRVTGSLSCGACGNRSAVVADP